MPISKPLAQRIVDVLEALKPGETVLLKAGTYHGTVPKPTKKRGPARLVRRA